MKTANPLNDLMGYHLRRASISMELDIRNRLKPYGLTPILSTILILIDSNDKITQSTISQILSIKRANMVTCINTLEKAEYIRREAIDGRSQKLLLTEQGELVLAKALEEINQNESNFKAKVEQESPEELTKALSSLWE